MTTGHPATPNYLFEVSWEVCNKVGGIHTVISTKALTIVEQLKDNFILIGPDVWMETRQNPEFIEDKYIYRSWREKAESEGLRFRIGRWNIAGRPVVILVDFTPYYSLKDKILAELWEEYQLDSITGQWDYMEPAIFGFAAAKIIESFYSFNMSANDHIVAQFHEWMTGTGLLYLKKHIPQFGLTFTTHATALGRSIAGNGMPLYSELENYDPQTMAAELSISAKFSLEKIAARESDSFTTVSVITARECKHFLGRLPDVITPNGFEDSFVPAEDVFDASRQRARDMLFSVADAVTGTHIARESLLVINSGRYEYLNKGIELYIDALGRVNSDPDFDKNILAYIMVPAAHAGSFPHLTERMKEPQHLAPTGEFLTHALHNAENDPVLRQIRDKGLLNRPEDKVKIIFVPCYLDGSDGIFNMHYYDLLIGFDLSVFPSYYEPWGYTPLESMAFHIPTITTTLAGFGLWVLSQYPNGHGCVAVIKREEGNYEEVAENIAAHLAKCSRIPAEQEEDIRYKAWEVSRTALWKNLIGNYYDAYRIALEKADQRSELFRGKQQHDTVSKLSRIIYQRPEWKKVLIKTSLPESLRALRKLAANLWWSWNPEIQQLFRSINPVLFEKAGNNPYALLEILSLKDYQKLERNTGFLEKLSKAEQAYDAYMSRTPEPQEDPIAYFSMEFGLHDSLKIFSGGLGVLAGDYLKEASDSARNIVGVGLLYRYGYFHQSLSLLGDQISDKVPQKFSFLPLSPVRHCGDGEQQPSDTWVRIGIAFPGRTVFAKVWRVDVGRVRLYLLDTDVDENSADDRLITGQLYGGDNDMRFKQELLLGIGGIRLLDELKIKPSLYHCNEGHAAFTGLERLRKLAEDDKLNFYQAMEVVRSSTLFTTHTPVPAGHDVFSEDILRTYLPNYPARLGISWDKFFSLGRFNEYDGSGKFSMSVFAARISQEMNGVSRIHGQVTREMFKELYPGYFPEELHIDHVTNGVHFPTWVSSKMKKLLDTHLPPEYLADQSNPLHWQKIYEIEKKLLWKTRQQLRSELVEFVKKRLEREMTTRQESPGNIFKMAGGLNEKTLTIGFARRFATYKRAHLLFLNPERLKKIICNETMPVQIIFAGKAHPNDKAGQDIIKKIYEFSKRPEFIGRVIFLENYDMDLATKLVSGVDIWLNTPTRPQEASGTSGEKAAMNGTINFSVLDGWWADGYEPGAGWALKEERTYSDQRIQDELDSESIYTILEDEIIPAFYQRNDQGIPEIWVEVVRNTLARVAPHFTMKRMLDEYFSKYYNGMLVRAKMMEEDDFRLAREMAAWKMKLFRGWESIEIISMDVTDSTQKPMALGDSFKAEIVLNLNELSGTDIGIEIIFGQKHNGEVARIFYKEEMQMKETGSPSVTFYCNIPANRTGVFDFAFRVFPKNPMLPHRQDINLIRWL